MTGVEGVPLCHPFLAGYSPVPGDTISTEIGLRYFEVEIGTGPEVAPGDLIFVHSAGYLLSGAQIDLTCGTDPYPMEVGAGVFIEGYEAGMIGLRTGGVRRLIIPPELGFGDQDNPPVPANSTLIFDVQLVEIR
jgi:FKBP-type peptidyl-prolyl cis-trans isomerase